MGTSIVSPKSKTLVPITTSADDDSIAAAQTPGGAGDLTLAGTAANPVADIAGDTITMVNSTVAGARLSLKCLTDDGTNSTWKADCLSTPVMTIA